MTGDRKTGSEVWLVGAGFSRALSEHLDPHLRMPLTTDLAKKLLELADDGYLTKETASLVRELEGPLGRDTEAWLTYLLGAAPYLSDYEKLRNRAAGMELADMVAQVVDEAQANFDISEAPEWVRGLGTYWFDNCVDIITLNYDTLAEQILNEDRRQNAGGRLDAQSFYRYPMRGLFARAGGGMFGPGDPSPVQVLKLHGSTNWHREDVPLDSLGAATYVSQFRRTRAREAVGVRPLILPPTYTKAGFYDLVAIRAQWTESREAIQYASRLIIVGTSLRVADWDLRQLLVTAVLGPAGGVERVARVREKEILIVDPSNAPSENLKELLRDHKVTPYQSTQELLTVLG